MNDNCFLPNMHLKKLPLDEARLLKLEAVVQECRDKKRKRHAKRVGESNYKRFPKSAGNYGESNSSGKHGRATRSRRSRKKTEHKYRLTACHINIWHHALWHRDKRHPLAKKCAYTKHNHQETACDIKFVVKVSKNFRKPSGAQSYRNKNYCNTRKKHKRHFENVFFLAECRRQIRRKQHGDAAWRKERNHSCKERGNN